MLTKIKLFLAVLVMMGSFSVGTFAMASAADLKGDACAGLNTLDSGSSSPTCPASNGVTNLIKAIINILSIIVGVAAVIVIIIAGLKFITAGGDSAKVAEAKNTLIYALVGLAVAVAAQFLIHFAIDTTVKATK